MSNGILFQNFEKTGSRKVKRDLQTLISLNGLETIKDTVQLSVILTIPTSNVKTNFDPDAAGSVSEKQAFINFGSLFGVINPEVTNFSPILEVSQNGSVADVVIRFSVKSSKVGGPGKTIAAKKGAKKKASVTKK
ncbi:MAG: hypothetical protein NTW29_05385 [Bacteroidetes bacterium]|nr:hypothetical protein [Bacteroidota bacterium]